MRNVVVWSGGCDSTLILHNLAVSSSKSSPVIAISIIWKEKINSMKMIKEREARNNYLIYAKRKGFHIESHTVTLSSTLGIDARGSVQTCLWFCAIVPFINSWDKIYFGYHVGDDFWGQHSEIYHALRYLLYVRDIKEEDVKLVYPLQYDSKCDILKKLSSLRIPRKCFWWCEDPVRRGKNIIMCGNCNPCITHKLALYEKTIRKQKGKESK